MKTLIERVLVPLDGSPLADSAIEAIGPLLRMHQPEVLLLGVMHESEYNYPLRNRLDHACDDLRSKGVDASVVLREGKPAPMIICAERRALS